MHGGAGVIKRKNMIAETETKYRNSLQKLLEQGGQMLANGASALDVVEVGVRTLENDEKFNAGKGAVFSSAEQNELDASIMDGRDRNAGAVASVLHIKNPISLARKVMENSRHVLLMGAGAEKFAKAQNIEMVDQKYFFTQRRWQQLQKKMVGRHTEIMAQTSFGTVGVVVKDACGDLAAGTSTGGLTAKKWGRVGDTPIIGAGTYADNRYCAVSATGTGEYFIRASIARGVCDRREYLGEDLQTAMDKMIHGELAALKGKGGIIAIDEKGNFGFSFNTSGMYRGAIKHDMSPIVKIFKRD